MDLGSQAALENRNANVVLQFEPARTGRLCGFSCKAILAHLNKHCGEHKNTVPIDKRKHKDPELRSGTLWQPNSKWQKKKNDKFGVCLAFWCVQGGLGLLGVCCISQTSNTRC